MDTTYLMIIALITIFLSFYNFLFLIFLMLVKIFPKRKELQKNSQYIPMFDISLSNQSASKNKLLYYIDLIFVVFFTIICLVVAIIFSYIIKINIYIISYVLIYSVLTFFIIIFSKLSDLDKFYLELDAYEFPRVFIRTKNKIIERLIKYMGVLILVITFFWIIFGLLILIINWIK